MYSDDEVPLVEDEMEFEKQPGNKNTRDWNHEEAYRTPKHVEGQDVDHVMLTMDLPHVGDMNRCGEVDDPSIVNSGDHDAHSPCSGATNIEVNIEVLKHQKCRRKKAKSKKRRRGKTKHRKQKMSRTSDELSGWVSTTDAPYCMLSKK